MVHAPIFRSSYAEPGEYINLSPPRPRIHKRFGIWGCKTNQPFVYGCGYTPQGAYEEWKRIYTEKVSGAQ